MVEAPVRAEPDLRRNLPLLYGLRFLRPFLLVIPVLVPFLQSNGLHQTQIYLLESAYAVTVVAGEVPSGYLADRFSRKLSLLAGSVLLVAGAAVWSGASGFGPLLAGQVLLGAGYVGVSGTDSAMAYDTLAALGRLDEYQRFEGRGNGLSAVSEALASLAGGALVLVSLRTPVLGQMVVYAAMVPVVLLLAEPPRIRAVDRHAVRDVLRITRYALHGHRELRRLILYGAVIATLTRTVIFLIQPYYQAAGIPLRWFGVLWAAQFVVTAVVSLHAHRYERLLGIGRSLNSFLVIGVLSYLVLGAFVSAAALPALLGLFVVRAVNVPILLDAVNRRIGSDVRATVLSVRSLAHNLLYAVIGPILGLLVDHCSLRVALLSLAAFYASAALWLRRQ